MHSCKRDQLLTADELAELRALPATLAHDPEYDDSTLLAGPIPLNFDNEPRNGGHADPVGYWRRQAEVEASNARDARMHVRQLRKEMAREEWRAFQFGWGLVLTWCVIIALAWTGVV